MLLDMPGFRPLFTAWAMASLLTLSSFFPKMGIIGPLQESQCPQHLGWEEGFPWVWGATSKSELLPTPFKDFLVFSSTSSHGFKPAQFCFR